MFMTWDIGEWNDSTREFTADRTAIVNGKVLKDGVHRVVFNYIDVQTSAHVIVENGQFADTTEKFIGNAVARADYWGTFIEGFDYDKDGNLEVVIGS